MALFVPERAKRERVHAPGYPKKEISGNESLAEKGKYVVVGSFADPESMKDRGIGFGLSSHTACFTCIAYSGYTRQIKEPGSPASPNRLAREQAY